ncbi:MAG: PulJ/GspJ family protein [Planctomycetota bacterium]
MKHFHHAEATRTRRGLTMVEMIIGVAVLTILGLSIASSTGSMKDMSLSGATQERLQLEARKAIRAIAQDIRLTANTTIEVDDVSLPYPVFFGSEEIPPLYEAHDHDHDLAPKASEEGDYEYGEDQSILFVLPADEDADGAPDFSIATGLLAWESEERVSYSRQLDGEGRPCLMRAVDGEGPRIVARDLELVRFDHFSVETPEVPINTIRVQLSFRAESERGHTYRHRVETLIRMRSKD